MADSAGGIPSFSYYDGTAMVKYEIATDNPKITSQKNLHAKVKHARTLQHAKQASKTSLQARVSPERAVDTCGWDGTVNYVSLDSKDLDGEWDSEWESDGDWNGEDVSQAVLEQMRLEAAGKLEQLLKAAPHEQITQPLTRKQWEKAETNRGLGCNGQVLFQSRRFTGGSITWDGLDAKDAGRKVKEFSTKKYKSHRHIPETVARLFDVPATT
ncbi:hypothetical protein WG66_000778 [Moniliophthora roreri]|nr:hypothetical protein WG66_000778 [Moniliophthora roreri]